MFTTLSKLMRMIFRKLHHVNKKILVAFSLSGKYLKVDNSLKPYYQSKELKEQSCLKLNSVYGQTIDYSLFLNFYIFLLYYARSFTKFLNTSKRTHTTH